MPVQRTLDLSALPDAALGSRAPLWWGQIGMMLIETVVFSITIAAYFYIRLGFSVWPPPRIAPPDLYWSTAGILLLVASCVPMYLSGRAIEQGRLAAAAIWVALNILMALGFLLIRTVEFNRFNFKWTTDVYGSLVWVLLGLHTMHTVADCIESIVIFGIILTGRVGGKQQLGAKLDGIYWYWITGAGVVLYLLIYIYPAISRGTL
jgi:heme/copper-type cytochrome/quinol oxidase subunit 3